MSQVSEFRENVFVGLSESFIGVEVFDLVPGVEIFAVIFSVEDSLVNLQDGGFFSAAVVVGLKVNIYQERCELDLDLEVVVVGILSVLDSVNPSFVESAEMFVASS